MDRYGLIGHPLGHSFSLRFFNDKFVSEGIDAEYCNYDIEDLGRLPEIIAGTPSLKGLNVTIPYKQKVIPLLDDLSPEAKAVGAVNVIKVSRVGGKTILKGFNSDTIGFTSSIRPLLRPSHHHHALVLGTGGAAKAVKHSLDRLGLKTQYVSRSRKPGCITYGDVTPAMVREYKVVVNCTPLGMFPNVNECPDLPYGDMDSNTLLYDLIYNPAETMFMRMGAKYGAAVKNGEDMLLLQAYASWDFWNS